jgi:hypothetical protein
VVERAADAHGRGLGFQVVKKRCDGAEDVAALQMHTCNGWDFAVELPKMND